MSIERVNGPSLVDSMWYATPSKSLKTWSTAAGLNQCATTYVSNRLVSRSRINRFSAPSRIMLVEIARGGIEELCGPAPIDIGSHPIAGE